MAGILKECPVSLDCHTSDGYKSCRGLRIVLQAFLCNFWHVLGRRVRALRSPLSVLRSLLLFSLLSVL